jgi:hypothetical protein
MGSNGFRLAGVFFASLFLNSISVLAQLGEQTVEITGFRELNEPGLFSLEVQHTSTSPQLSGLGLRLHFDASLIEFDGFETVLSKGLVAQAEPQPDTANHDGDSSTDQFVLVGWADLGGNWPGENQIRLFTARFKALGEGKVRTPIHFTASSVAAGCRFTPVSFEVSIPPAFKGPDREKRVLPGERKGGMP